MPGSLNLAHTGCEDTKNPLYQCDMEESFVINYDNLLSCGLTVFQEFVLQVGEGIGAAVE